jgi:uncharacterized membrane protein
MSELRRFLVSLNKSTYAEIQRRKNAVLDGIRSGVGNQSQFQGVISLVLFLLAPVIAAAMGLETPTLRIVLTGVDFHLIFLTLMNFQFYLEYYRRALRGGVIFFLVNLAGSLTALPGIPTLRPGVSYLVAAVAASIYAAVSLFATGRRMDRIILAGAGSG